jgi:site-specific DNA-methyltransferase (adenine-specific)
MGKKWDTTGNFYDWCFKRAEALYRVIKSGGYVLIFGHPKTNHRMKCAFEDAGFQIVEEIDWIYGTGFPKNQDIGKLFDKKAGVEREIIGISNKQAAGFIRHGRTDEEVFLGTDKNRTPEIITKPSTELAKQWNGWKTAGLKPAHEPITVFQKPLEGTYIQNIEKYNCGGMNIDACRIPTSQEDKDMINAKASKNPTTNYSESEERIYGAYAEDKSMPANEIGRFPANMIFDSSMSEVLDGQSGIQKSGTCINKTRKNKKSKSVYGDYNKMQGENIGYNDKGGASRYFLKIDEEDFVPFLYCAKPTKKEKGEGNSHVTVKPKELIKWLIKLVTPIDGRTIDITAGSGTHGVACEELNRDENYNLHWLNIEMLNTEKEPYCEIAKNRIQEVIEKVS